MRGGTAPPAEPAGEPTELPPLPDGVSRVDTLLDGFVHLLSRRPHLSGDIIAGRYQLEEKLGDGAMGQVFAAVNLVIKRRVAIKVLKPEVLADAQFRRRFQSEAEAIARIDHRNVAHFIDLVVGDPTFLVMEHVAGPTLGMVLRQEKKLEPRRAIAIATRLCWALEAAHRAGVVHRDVKPGNVILAPDPELGEEPKLIDFGLAKLASSATDAPTRVGQIVGTPHYMAPEQIANKPVDARADIYALGCVLYHMVSGRPPFEGEGDVQLMYQHMQSAAPALDSVAPDAPPGLTQVIERALNKEPDGRFASMREMATALGALERRRPVVVAGVRDGGGAPPARRGGRLVRALAIGIAASATAAALGWIIGERTHGQAAPNTLLVVDTVPAGARLRVDDAAQPQTTPVVLSALAAGRHRVRVELAGRDVVERTIELARGQRQVLTLQLPPASHRLELETNPAGATVFLDGKLNGLTPITLQLSDDDFHELRLEKSGYEAVKRGLPPELRDPTLSFTLQAQTRAVGQLVVTADAALPVFVDGLDSGFLAPTIELEVLAGPHLVELRDFDAKPVASAQVTVTRGDTLRVQLQRRQDAP